MTRRRRNSQPDGVSRTGRAPGRDRPSPPAGPGLASTVAAAPWWVQLAACGMLIAGGVVAWQRFTDPGIPRPILEAADPAVVLAIDDAESRVRQAPQSANTWGNLGLVLYAQSYAAEGVECFRRATALDDRSWRWPFFAAVARSHVAPEQAAELMEEAIRRDPAAVWPRLLRAEWLVPLGRAEEARIDYDALLAASPDHARARMGLARLLLAGGRADEALSAIGSAMDHPSTRRAAHLLAAQIATRRGDTAEAGRLAQQSATLPADAPWPEDPLAAELPLRRVGKRSRIKRVSQLEQAGALDDADALTRRVERDNPEIYLFVEGRLQLAKGDFVAAEKAFRRSVQFDPRAAENHFQLGRAIALQGRRADAADVYRGLLAIEPAYGPAWLELGRCLLDTDRTAALAALASAVAYMPASDDAREELARAQAGTPPPDPPPRSGPGILSQ